MADEESQGSSTTPQNPSTMAGQLPQNRSVRRRTLGDLPITLIVKILLRLSLTSLPAASVACAPFHEIINSPQFSRAYDQHNKQHRWIVTDNSGGLLCDPALFFYDISLKQWHKLLISKICPQQTPLNPRMVSAYGGLILFTASKKDNNGQPLQERELVVLNPLSRQTRRLPDPPISLSSDNPCDECIEMVADKSGLSYKVIVLSFKVVNTVFIFDGSLQDWHSVQIPEILPPGIEPESIVSSRGVVYQSILCWLILIDLDASFLIFYDTERDALIRETLHISEAETRGLCGIVVCGDHIVKIWRQTEGIISYPELNVSMLGGDSGQWELDHTVRLSALGWDPVCLKGSGLQLLGGFVMNCHVQGEGKSSKPMVQLASRHITCVEDAAIFMALTAAVDLSIEACRPFSRKPRRGIRN